MQKTIQKPRVVILGAGFGGLTAARKMASFADVTIVDRHNFQTFLPLLYQVSTAGLAADHVAHPIRGALRKTGIQFRMGTPISVDHKNKSVKLDSSEVLDFDYLVVALGSATADFGIPGVAEHALGMKSVHEALTIRAEVLRRFEDLCRFEDETIFSGSRFPGGADFTELDLPKQPVGDPDLDTVIAYYPIMRFWANQPDTPQATKEYVRYLGTIIPQ